LIFKPNGDLNCNRVGAEAGDNRLERAIKRCAGAIEFVDKTNSWYAILIGLPPHGLRLRLDTSDAVEYSYGTVEHTQRTLNFHGEVDVTGSVDNIDAMIDAVSLPVTGCSGAGNRDTALLLLLHPVHRRRTLVHLANFVRDARVIEDPFRGGGLTGIDVGHDADIPRQI